MVLTYSTAVLEVQHKDLQLPGNLQPNESLNSKIDFSDLYTTTAMK
jgi:hypothetical protein